VVSSPKLFNSKVSWGCLRAELHGIHELFPAESVVLQASDRPLPEPMVPEKLMQEMMKDTDFAA
jgi:hypothetical protein